MNAIKLNNTYFNLDNLMSIELCGFEGCRQVMVNNTDVYGVTEEEYQFIEKILDEGVLK